MVTIYCVQVSGRSSDDSRLYESSTRGFTCSSAWKDRGCLAPHGKRYSSLFLQDGVGGTLYPSSAPAGAPAAPGRSASPCFAAESARGGTLMSLPEGIATPAVRGTRLGASGGAVSSVVTSGCPKRSEGGFPVGTRTVTSASSAQQEEICGAPPLSSEGRNEDEHCLLALPQRPISSGIRGRVSPRAQPSRSRR